MCVEIQQFRDQPFSIPHSVNKDNEPAVCRITVVGYSLSSYPFQGEEDGICPPEAQCRSLNRITFEDQSACEKQNGHHFIPQQCCAQSGDLLSCLYSWSRGESL